MSTSITKYYIDKKGNYLGGYAGSKPDSGIEVPSAPSDARDTWDGSQWVPFSGPDKMKGVEFQGVMCSATKEDMWGLNSIESYIRGGQDVPFEFSNGNVLVLTPSNVDAFKAVWVPFRASFFK